MTKEIALLTPNMVTEDFDTSFQDERMDPQSLTHQKFIRPQLTQPKKTDLRPQSMPDPSQKLYRFGVVMEEPTSEVLSEVTRDLIALISSLPPGSSLVVVSPTSTEFWDKAAKTLPIQIQQGDFPSVNVWKVYWFDKKPFPPEGVKFKFEKRIGNPNLKKIILRPGTDVAMPRNKDDNRMLPMGMNPAYRRQPALSPVNVTPQLYLWSNVLTSE